MTERTIQIGDFSLVYDQGFVRYISIGDSEIVRKVYFALRDKNWDTAELVRSDEQVEVDERSFSIRYTATSRFGAVDVIRWTVHIEGFANGEFQFSIDGTVLTPYWRNRVGICVLHPIRETLGQPAKVTQPDGVVYERDFPNLIVPHQPFLEIQKFYWLLSNGVRATLAYEGDIFEMEDQRNWSDTSFKTYSTPLRIPYPVELEVGQRITQKVKLVVDRSNVTLKKQQGSPVEIDVDFHKQLPFPKVGTNFSGRSTEDRAAIEKLKQLQFDHLRIELRLSDPSWALSFAKGMQEAARMGTAPFLHLVFGTKAELEWDAFESKIRSKGNSDISRVALSPLDRKADVNKLLQLILSKARKLFPTSMIGAGFVSYFTELNRNRFDVTGIDFLVYSLNPQVHATDTLTVIENLPAQADAVRSAKAISGHVEVHAGPVSLRPRFNPDAMGDNLMAETSLLPSKYDSRQATPLAAGWSLASLKYLAESGANSITMFEVHGMAGYLLANDDDRHPLFAFDSDVFPVWKAWSALRSLKPNFLIKSESYDPLRVTSLVVGNDDASWLFLINHRDAQTPVRVVGEAHLLAPYEVKISPIKFTK